MVRHAPIIAFRATPTSSMRSTLNDDSRSEEFEDPLISGLRLVTPGSVVARNPPLSRCSDAVPLIPPLPNWLMLTFAAKCNSWQHAAAAAHCSCFARPILPVTMAERSKFFCALCEKDCLFLSKYERHVNSASHLYQ